MKIPPYLKAPACVPVRLRHDVDRAGVQRCARMSQVVAAGQYRDVIESLWPVLDDASADIAEQVYRSLTGDGGHPPHTRRSAAALHEAIRTRSASDPGRPSRWAPHIHVGG